MTEAHPGQTAPASQTAPAGRAAPAGQTGSAGRAAPAGQSRLAEVCGVVLAAGEGQRLRPLTEQLPKALCPVGNVALLDRALARLAALGLAGPRSVAVNAAYLAGQVVTHVGDRAQLSVEPDGPLGTAGGVARLRSWIDGRGALVGNADAYLADPARDPGKDIASLLDGWSGETVRMLTRPVPAGATGGFSGHRFAGFSLMPWRYLKDLEDQKSDLVRTVWRPAEAAGDLELVPYDGLYIDTGTPADYLAANLHAAAGRTLTAPGATLTAPVTHCVIGAGAHITAPLTRCVVWPDATAGTPLTDAVVAPGGVVVHA